MSRVKLASAFFSIVLRLRITAWKVNPLTEESFMSLAYLIIIGRWEVIVGFVTMLMVCLFFPGGAGDGGPVSQLHPPSLFSKLHAHHKCSCTASGRHGMKSVLC